MQPDLNNLKAKIQANRDFIDRITVQIPFSKDTSKNPRTMTLTG
jgi:hypothetical protein